MNEPHDGDIYRGPPRRSTSPRLGVLSTVLEIAISRWARANDADSDLDTLSDRPSIRRRRGAATIHSLQSERDFTAHISLLKAREQSRQIPPQFTLYLPPSLAPRSASLDAKHHVISTASLSTLLPQLDTALKKAARAYRNHTRQRAPVTHTNLRDCMLQSPAEPPAKPPSWYLDVASPTWQDMRTLGKMLHLHPLTLDDILQRDPREKLEHFPKLGYYFISFRAIETRDGSYEPLDGSGQDGGLLGAANVYMVVRKEGICSTFLVSEFSNIEGNISLCHVEHTDRVRTRTMLLEQVFNMSSDWIAHGLLDSIVDSFFPLLDDITREVTAIQDLVLTSGRLPGALNTDLPIVPPHRLQEPVEKRVASMMINSLEIEKGSTLSVTRVKPRFTAPHLTFALVLRRVRKFFHKGWDLVKIKSPARQPSSARNTLLRMARTRKLVVSLARLLATKSEVITQIRKRLLASNNSTIGSGARHNGNGDLDIAIYMTNVQGVRNRLLIKPHISQYSLDHILMLQHSLAHCDHILSSSHPIYLSHLRAAVVSTKSQIDKMIMYVSVVSVGVICVQTLVGATVRLLWALYKLIISLGICSMNTTVPGNPLVVGAPLNAFYIVLAMSLCILSGYAYFVRRWWKQAAPRHRQRLAR
ncbi:hypothetical protein H0H81_001561 [Sphagnurus paluster]|uniref:Uncharacterized protein n=1 Tax=Sphagnurus paluster TaxID=117069 RepID=A0A9P7GM89_9AGAR|nr:hypothetical protein H0H81_001561 [Sphagnurus paluster]